MYKLYSILLFSILLSSCSTTYQNQVSTSQYKPIAGLWALEPLEDGTANVIKFTEEGESTLYPFNCIKESTHNNIISSTFVMTDDKFHLYLNLGENFEESFKPFIRENRISILQITENSMQAYDFVKTDQITPICAQQLALQEKFGMKLFEESGFIENPWFVINIDDFDFSGEWKNKEGITKISINKNADDLYKIESIKSNGQHDLYGNIHWRYKKLHITSFIYTEASKKHNQPEQKKSYPISITPLNEANKIKYTIIINNQEFDEILTRQ